MLLLHSPRSRLPDRAARRHALVPGRRPGSRRLRIEAFEDRLLPSCTLGLVPSEPAPQLVGERVLWTATATDCGADPVYQFSTASAGGAFRVARDFSPTDNFPWAPMQEGDYDIRVVVKDGYSGTQTASAVVSDLVNSRITGHDAVITPAANPLVVLYSAPPCSDGTIHVEFAKAGHHPDWRITNSLPCEPGESRNFIVAGMLPDTTYQMRHVITDHHHHQHSSSLFFTTGVIPSSLVFSSFTVIQPPGPGSDLDHDMLFHQLGNAPSNTPNPVATDLNGQIVWYYDVSQSGFIRTYPGQSLVPGGTVLILGHDQYGLLSGTLDVVREIDLAGNSLRETNIDAVNQQLTVLRYNPIYSFTHDVERLPNGQTAVIGSTERTIDVNGTPTEYVGMSIVVLDENFQVVWAWDGFDHLDVNRGPILGEILNPGDTDQVAASTPVLPAVDWMHANAISWSPADRNLVLSMRNQDWAIKVDYEGGSGDGHIIWRLGHYGDFSVDSKDPFPWFSHQHNAHFINDNTMVVFDNGNTRQASDPDADSRGQEWTLDERTMKATPVLNADLGNFSFALGSAQALANGNFSFTSGYQGDPPRVPRFGQSIEVRPDGTKAYVLQLDRALYRSFRVRTLYGGTENAPDNGDGASPGVGQHGNLGSASGVASGNLNGNAILDPGAIMELTGQAQPTIIDSVAYSTSASAEVVPPVSIGNAVAPLGPAGDQPIATLVSEFADSNSRARRIVRERVFAEFDGGWLSDAVLTELAMVD